MSTAQDKKQSKPLPGALAPLQELDRWVLWKRELRDGKETKPPYAARSPHAYASSTDPKTWSDYKTAAQAATELEPGTGGIGFVLTDSDLGGIDFDDCVQDGKIAKWVQRWVTRAHELSCYVETSPSGEGIRVIGRIKSKEKADKKWNIGDGSVELYRHAGRYVTITGREIGKCKELGCIDQLIDELLKARPQLEEIKDSTTSGLFYKEVRALIEKKGMDVDQIVEFIKANPKRFKGTKAAVYAARAGGLRAEVARVYEKSMGEVPAAARDIKWSTGVFAKSCLADAVIALDALGVCCCYDEFHNALLVNGLPGNLQRWAGQVSDNVVYVLRDAIYKEFAFDPGKEHLRDAVVQLCLRDPYNPILDYLEEVEDYLGRRQAHR